MTSAVVAIALIIGAFFIVGAVFGAVSVVAMACRRPGRPARGRRKGSGPCRPPGDGPGRAAGR